MISEKKRSAKGELVFTSFLFAVGLIVLIDTSQLPESKMADFVGSKTFPNIIGWLMVVFSLIQIVQVLRGNLGEPEEIEGGRADAKLKFKPLVLVLLGLFVFAFGIKIVGFLISATILFTLVVFALNPKKSKWYVVIPIAAAVAGIIYVGFVYGLNINLPWGFDFNFGSSEVVVEDW